MPSLTVAIPVNNGAGTLGATLRALERQGNRDFEVLVVDDGSTDETAALARAFGARVLTGNLHPRGAAAARNAAVAATRSPFIAFTDADCEPDPNWVDVILEEFARPDAPDALAGDTRVARGGELGDAIAALGWPGGGRVGFARMWPVDRRGRTRFLSGCNCAFRREAIERVVGYDESFIAAAGEDTLFAHRLERSGVRIRFAPRALVTHRSRSDLGGFLRWQFRRGRSAYALQLRVGSIQPYIRLRVWSMFNVLGLALREGRVFLVWPLWAAQVTAYVLGYLRARLARRASRGPSV